LFVAAEIGTRLAHKVGSVVDELRARVEASAPKAKVTWVAVDRLHVTVRFIGQVDDDRVEAFRRSLRRPLSGKAFDLSCGGVGSFPKGGSPRVLWVALADGTDALGAVERQISARLLDLGIAEESRPYTPHLTLARVREPAGLKSASLLEGLRDVRIGKTHIDAITLFESKLSPKGPTYVPLERIPFA
jgi:2'-5' RNA ligase